MRSNGIQNLIEESRIKPSDIFTDREEPRTVFWDHFNDRSQYMHEMCRGKDKAAKSSNAILYYGVGGIGKTRLLKKLKQELKEASDKKYRFAKYDFERDVNSLCTRSNCIKGLCKQLSTDYGFTFLLTELSFVKIASESSDDFNRKKETVNQIIDDSRVLKPLVIGLKFIPLIGNIISTCLDALEATETAVNKPILELFKQNEKDYRECIKYIQNKDVDVIQANIHALFAEDLEINLRKAENPLVIMLDTYEHYANVVGGGGYGNASSYDDWLKNPKTGLISSTPSVLWVLCGRDKLISEESSIGGSSWTAIGLDEHLLGNLSESDTKLYLREVGITNPELIENLYKVTKGLPVFLDFCYDLYREHTGYPEMQNCIETYGQTPERIIDRYLQGMSENMLDLIMSMSCLEFWTDDLVSYLRPEISNFSDISYKNFLSLSLVNKVEDRYYMHAIVKDLIFKSIKTPALVTRIRGKAASYYKLSSEKEPNQQRQASDLASHSSYVLSQCNEDSQALAFLKEITESLNMMISQRLFEEAFQVLALFTGFGITNKEIEVRIKTIASRILLESGKYREAYKILFSVPEIIDEITENTPDYIQDGMFTFGRTLLGLKPFDKGTLEFWEKFEIFYLKKYGMEYIRTIQALQFLAKIYTTLREYDKALEANTLCYKQYFKTLGENHPNTLSAQTYLAFSYLDLGEIKKAQEILEKVYKLRTIQFGSNHPDTLKVQADLALSYSKLGDIEKCLELSKESYELMINTLGAENPSTLTTLNNLAAVYSKHGDTLNALEGFKKVYKLRKKVLGEKHAQTLSALNNLAKTYSDIGNIQKALVLKERCYVIQKEILGDEHPETLSILDDLAVEYSKIQWYKKAAEVREKIYELRKKIWGEEHLYTFMSLKDLVAAYTKSGNRLKETEALEKCYILSKIIYGEETQDTLYALGDLVEASFYSNKLKAFELLKKWCELQEKIFGTDSQEVKSTIDTLGLYYSDHGDHQKSIEYQENLYNLKVKTLGPEHPDTLSALSNLALVYCDNFEPQKAIKLHEECYNLRMKVLGEKHQQTLWSFFYIAITYEALGQFQKSMELHKKCYALRKAVLGEEHEETQNSLKEFQFIQEEAQLCGDGGHRWHSSVFYREWLV